MAAGRRRWGCSSAERARAPVGSTPPTQLYTKRCFALAFSSSTARLVKQGCGALLSMITSKLRPAAAPGPRRARSPAEPTSGRNGIPAGVNRVSRGRRRATGHQRLREACGPPMPPGSHGKWTVERGPFKRPGRIESPFHAPPAPPMQVMFPPSEPFHALRALHQGDYDRYPLQRRPGGPGVQCNEQVPTLHLGRSRGAQRGVRPMTRSIGA